MPDVSPSLRLNQPPPPPGTVQVRSLNTGAVQKVAVGPGRTVLTAYGKHPREGTVGVGVLGLDGDEQGDPTVHGGRSKAVYAYPVEHYPFWQTVRAQAKLQLWDEAPAPGLMGENLTVQGLVEANAWIGDQLRFPHCTLAISEPRMPCGKFEAIMGFRQASKMMAQSGFCGFYLMVIEPGMLQVGDLGTVVAGPRAVNIAEAFRSRLGRHHLR